MLNVPQSVSNDSYPILRGEVEVAVKSPKKGRSGQPSTGADPEERRGHDRHATVLIICNKI